MKNLFFLSALVLVLAMPGAYAQKTVSEDIQKAITERLDLFFKATSEQDWDVVLDYTYDKLFTLASREQMKSLFEQMSAEGMEISMGAFKVNDFIGIAASEEERFVNIAYSMEMGMKFSGSQFSDPQVLGFMKTSFDATYGEENVKFDKEENSFQIKATKNLFAIAPIDSKEWKFVENNKEQAFILEQLIPEGIRKVFNE